MLGLGPSDRRCKSCRADQFRNGWMDCWIAGLLGSERVAPRQFINPLIQLSTNPIGTLPWSNTSGIRLLSGTDAGATPAGSASESSTAAC